MAPKKRATLAGHTQDAVWVWLATEQDSAWRLPLPPLSDAYTPVIFPALVSLYPLRACHRSGVSLPHPMREGRSPQQIGRKGLSNHRWIIGGKLCLVVNQYGLVVAWDCATANVADNTFQELMWQFEELMILLSDMAF